MSTSDAAPLPRLGEVFFDVRSASRSLRISWYSDTGVAVLSIWQGGTCTGSFRLPMTDLPRMIETLQRGPGGAASPGPGGHPAAGPAHAAGPDPFGGPASLHYLPSQAAAQGRDDSAGGHRGSAIAAGPGGDLPPPYPDEPGTVFYPGQPPYQDQPGQPPYRAQPGEQAHQDGPELYSGPPPASGYAGRPDAPRYSAPPGAAAYPDQPTASYPDQPTASYPVQPGEAPYPGQPGQSPYPPQPRHAPYAGRPGAERYPAGPPGSADIGHPDSQPESAAGPYSNGGRSRDYSAGRPSAEYPRAASSAYGNERPGWPGEPEPGWDTASVGAAGDVLEPLPESIPYSRPVPDRERR